MVKEQTPRLAFYQDNGIVLGNSGTGRTSRLRQPVLAATSSSLFLLRWRRSVGLLDAPRNQLATPTRFRLWQCLPWQGHFARSDGAISLCTGLRISSRHLPTVTLAGYPGRRLDRRGVLQPAIPSVQSSAGRLAPHLPVLLPVEGQGCSRWNSRVTSRDRYSFARTVLGAASSEAQSISAQNAIHLWGGAAHFRQLVNGPICGL
jgi:hypothetical protein